MRIDYKAPQEAKDRMILTRDTLLNQLKGLTPDEAAQWIENNVVDMASAKTVLKAMAKALVYIIRNELKREVGG